MSRKKVKQKDPITSRKIPRAVCSVPSYLKHAPLWAFSRCDKEQWSLFHSGLSIINVVETLAAYEGMTWQEIQSASGGKSEGHGSNSHFVELSALSSRAQKRAREIRLYELTDQLFSLRLNAKSRLWGFLMEGVFYVIWFDPNHEVYPINL